MPTNRGPSAPAPLSRASRAVLILALVAASLQLAVFFWAFSTFEVRDQHFVGAPPRTPQGTLIYELGNEKSGTRVPPRRLPGGRFCESAGLGPRRCRGRSARVVVSSPTQARASVGVRRPRGRGRSDAGPPAGRARGPRGGWMRRGVPPRAERSAPSARTGRSAALGGCRRRSRPLRGLVLDPGDPRSHHRGHSSRLEVRPASRDRGPRTVSRRRDRRRGGSTPSHRAGVEPVAERPDGRDLAWRSARCATGAASRTTRGAHHSPHLRSRSGRQRQRPPRNPQGASGRPGRLHQG